MEGIRAAGFDAVSDASVALPDHHRIIRPEGADGFTDANLARLTEAFQNTTGHWPMDTRRVRFIDSSGPVVATAQMADEDGRFGGMIDLRLTPSGLRSLFDEFEEIVDGQMLSFLDDIQQRIAAQPLRAAFDDGTETAASDLQAYPRAGDVPFRCAGGQAPLPQ